MKKNIFLITGILGAISLFATVVYADDPFNGPLQIGTIATSTISGDNATSTLTNGVNLPNGGCFSISGVCLNQYYNLDSAIWIGLNQTDWNSPIAIGHEAMLDFSSGNANMAVGNQALTHFTSGYYNDALGQAAGYTFLTGDGNVFLGNSTGNGSDISGWSGNHNVFVGVNTGSLIDVNGIINNNTFVGADAADGQILAGSNNILIGQHMYLPDPSASLQLNIQNIIYGINNSGTQYNISPGTIGIGTTSPSARFSIQANDGESNSALFTVASSTSDGNRTLYTINNVGHHIYGGTTPIVSSCGTSASVVGNDSRGRITVGSGTVTSCTLAFANAWASAPVCVFTQETGAVRNITAASSATSTIFKASASVAGDKMVYTCDGY